MLMFWYVSVFLFLLLFFNVIVITALTYTHAYLLRVELSFFFSRKKWYCISNNFILNLRMLPQNGTSGSGCSRKVVFSHWTHTRIKEIAVQKKWQSLFQHGAFQIFLPISEICIIFQLFSNFIFIGCLEQIWYTSTQDCPIGCIHSCIHGSKNKH